jgi:hypothetical protein
MKITKATLKKLIKEELEEMYAADSERDYQTEIGVLIETAITVTEEASAKGERRMKARLSNVKDYLVLALEELTGL